MDDGQKTPRGHPDFHSYMKIPRVFIFQPLQTDRITDRETNTLATRGLEEFFSAVLEKFLLPLNAPHVYGTFVGNTHQQ
jgi:hypothetical protein